MRIGMRDSPESNAVGCSWPVTDQQRKRRTRLRDDRWLLLYYCPATFVVRLRRQWKAWTDALAVTVMEHAWN